MRLQLNTKIILGFGIALVMLLLTSLIAYFSIQQLRFYTRQVEHTNKVLQYTSDLRMRMRDAQTALRSYLLVNDSSYLTNFDTHLPAVRVDYDSLLQFVADNPLQVQRLDTLKKAIDRDEVHLRQWRQVTPSAAAAQRMAIADRPLLLEMRNLMTRIRTEEEQLLWLRSQRQNFYAVTTPITLVISAGLAIIIVLILFNKIWAELQANQRLQAELAQVNQDTAYRIYRIEELAERVAQGDYTVRIPDDAQDSLGNLATSLNRMTHTLDSTFGALQYRNRELDQFAYVASHDLKAPLRGVMTVVKWIEEELPHELSEQMHQYLTMMKGRLIRLEDLINGLLAYARIGRTDQALEEVDVRQLLTEVAELVVPATFRLALTGELPVFSTNRLGLQQVFTNLLSNAAKYHDRGEGLITVSGQETAREYVFRVTDDGPGIAAEYHEKIFLLFQTLRDRHSAESTGIGLSIVRKIIDEQQGSIRVESVPGQGATFIFTWPKPGQPGSAA